MKYEGIIPVSTKLDITPAKVDTIVEIKIPSNISEGASLKPEKNLSNIIILHSLNFIKLGF
jgi:hypothetical protein